MISVGLTAIMEQDCKQSLCPVWCRLPVTVTCSATRTTIAFSDAHPKRRFFATPIFGQL
jgi:hypothetical protein